MVEPLTAADLPESALRHLERAIAAAPPAPWLLHETGDDEDDCPRVDALWTLTIDLDTPGPLGDGDLLYFGAPDNWALTQERIERMRATVRVIQTSQRAMPLLIAEVRRLREELRATEAHIEMAIDALDCRTPPPDLHPADKVEKYLLRDVYNRLTALGWQQEERDPPELAGDLRQRD